MIEVVKKWLKNPFQQFAIRFLGAPPESDPVWQDPEVKKKVRTANIFLLWGPLALLVLILILGLLLNLVIPVVCHAFAIRTSPPIQMSGFVCECNFENCICKQGEITLTLVYNPQRKAEWEAWALRNMRKNIFGQWEEPLCQEYCVAYISDVVHVKLPYLSFSTLESAERAASLSLKKSMSITEKASSMISAVLQSVGIKTESDENMNLVREKLF